MNKNIINFITSFVLGSVSMYLPIKLAYLVSPGIKLIFEYLTIILPTLIVVVYSIILFFKNKNNLKKLRDYSETPYFLGFLFTLSSILITFLTFSKRDIQLNILINLIGAALLTTVMGVICKIYIQHYLINYLKEDLIDVDIDTHSVIDVINSYLKARNEDIKYMKLLSKKYEEDVENFSEKVNNCSIQIENFTKSLVCLSTAVNDSNVLEVINSSTCLTKEINTLGNKISSIKKILNDFIKVMDIKIEKFSITVPKRSGIDHETI